jgi:class 3 adenylate cyclase
MTPVTAAEAASLTMLAVVAAASGSALRRPRETREAAVAAAAGVLAAIFGTDGVLWAVALVLGLAACLRFGFALLAASRDRPTRLWAALERENAVRGRFFPHTLFERLGRGSLADVALGDRVTETMTILIADIRDSTGLTESLSSEEAFVLIADFFARSARVVRAHRGSIDKYLGDGFMALFPRRVDDALDAAIALQAAVATLNEEGLGPAIEIGVGVHTGLVTFGTVGDARHIDTTVVAETVNTAKRIEGLSKRLRVPVVTTGKVVRAIRESDNYFVRPLGPQSVRGKREPLVVYAVDWAPLVRQVTAKRRERDTG